MLYGASWRLEKYLNTVRNGPSNSSKTDSVTLNCFYTTLIQRLDTRCLMKADLNLGLEITYLFFRRLGLVLACNHWTEMLVEKMIQLLGQSREL